MPTDLKLIGYFMKGTARPSNYDSRWLPPSVLEICSVSTCLTKSPEGWIEKWLHNDLGFYNTRDDARATVADQPDGFHLFAFRLLPIRFVEGAREPLPIPDLPVEPLPDAFSPLGFDVVSRSDSIYFECSPLSCNGLGNEVPINGFCLLETLAEAESFADRCSREEPEPGDYFVLEVLREVPDAPEFPLRDCADRNDAGEFI